MIVRTVRSSEEGMGSSGADRLVAKGHSGALVKVLASTILSPVPTECIKDLAARSRKGHGRCGQCMPMREQWLHAKLVNAGLFMRRCAISRTSHAVVDKKTSKSSLNVYLKISMLSQ